MSETLTEDFEVFVRTEAEAAEPYTGREIDALRALAAKTQGDLHAIERNAALFEGDRNTAKVQVLEKLTKQLEDHKYKVGSALERRADLIEKEVLAVKEPPRAAQILAQFRDLDPLEVQALYAGADDEIRAALATAPPIVHRDPQTKAVSLRPLLDPQFFREDALRRNPEAAQRIDKLRSEARRHAGLANQLVQLARRKAGVQPW